MVVWRLPRDESLVSPGSHCPKCNTPLAWFDNIPVFGWLALRGKCRYCKEPISPRYPIIEAVTGLLFAFYYAMFFIWQIGPCAPAPLRVMNELDGTMMEMVRPLSLLEDWPIYVLGMLLVSALLAASLIDAELFIIPIEIPWFVGIAGVIVHTFADRPTLPGGLTVGPLGGAISLGGLVGLLISIALFKMKLIARSFPDGEPLLEVDRDAIAKEIEDAKREGRSVEEFGQLPPPYSRRQIRLEIGKEMLFLLPPLILACAFACTIEASPSLSNSWTHAISHDWFSGFLGAVLGGLIGGFTVWLTRILGTLGFGRVAMGLGDVHLMLGVGAVIGAGASIVAFFLAPFFGILIAVWMLVTGKRRELPYGPYLSLATAVVMLCYCPIAAYLSPGMQGMVIVLRRIVGLPE